MAAERQGTIRLIRAVLTVLAVWFILRYAAGIAAPFVFAWLTASLIEPVIVHMTERFHIRRGFSSVLCSTVVLLSVVGIAALAAARAFRELADLAEQLPGQLEFLPALIDSLRRRGQRFIASVPDSVKSYLISAGDGITESITALPGELSGRIPAFLTGLAAALPDAALFTAAYAVGVFFISASYPKIIRFFMCQLDEGAKDRALKIVSAARSGFFKWLRAQLTMSGVMFGVLLTAFLLIAADSPLLLAVFTAVVDALPVLGVGAVLVPWSVIEAIGGRGGRAAVIAAIWLLCLALRSFLEPRLVGRQSGVDPAAALLAAYCGWRLFGVAGLIGCPLILIVLQELNGTGVLHIWNTPE